MRDGALVLGLLLVLPCLIGFVCLDPPWIFLAWGIPLYALFQDIVRFERDRA